MKIDSFEINRFGIFVNQGIDKLSPGLTLICAGNGGGKTTLRGFLRAGLFGFDGKYDNRYLLDSLLPHNGHINFSVDKAAYAGSGYRVTFDAKTNKRQVARLDGELAPELGLLLGSASAQLYRNIFAIGLAELQDASQLNDEKVQTLIGAVGSGKSGQSFQKVHRALNVEAEEIFKPSGRVTKANKKLNEIAQLQEDLNRHRVDEDDYGRTNQLLGEHEEMIESTRAEQEKARLENDHVHNLDKAWPHYVASVGLNKELEAVTPRVESFPASGREQLANLDNQHRALTADLALTTEQLKKNEQEFSDLNVTEELLEFSGDIDDLLAKLALYEQKREDLKLAVGASGLLEANLASEMAMLGNWSHEQLAAFDNGVQSNAARAQAGRAYGDAVRAANDSEAETHRLQNEAERKNAELAAAWERFRAKWQAPPPTQQKLDERTRILAGIAAGLAEAARLADRGVSLERESAEAQRQIAQIEAQLTAVKAEAGSAAAAPPSPDAPLRRVSWIPLIVLGGLAALFHRQPTAAGFFALAALVAFAIAWLYPGNAAVGTAVAAPPNPYLDEQLNYWRGKAESVAGDLARAQAMAGHADAALQELYRVFGTTVTDAAACEDIRLKLDEARERSRQAEQETQTIARLQEAAANTANDFQRARERETRLKSELETMAERWRAWLSAHGLATGFSPEVAEALCDQVRRAQDIQAELAGKKSDIAAMQSTTAAFENEMSTLFAQLKRPLPPPAESGRTLRRLVAERDEARHNQQRRESLRETITERNELLERKNSELEKCAAARQGLLEEGGAVDSAEFELRAAAWAHRRELSRQLDECRNSLEVLSAPGEAVARLQAQLSGLDHETLQRQLAATASALEAADTKLSGLIGEQGELQLRRRQLEHNDEVALKTSEQALATTELGDLAENWALHRLAAWLMDKARKRYEDERQPVVLQSAGDFLATMTGGAVTRLVKPLDSNAYRIHFLDGRVREGEQVWNSALREQTYLGLRFGLIDAYSNQSEPLPIILDDALVNLDPAHLQGAVNCIHQLSKRHQVIYLTCHPHTELCFAELPEPPVAYRIVDGKFEEITRSKHE